MIKLTLVRELTLKVPPSAGRPAHLSAASGLVRVRGQLYVVADDEVQLGVFPVVGHAPGDLVRLFPGELPAAHNARKATKPDLEVLVRLPPFVNFRTGALLALGSGSTPNRQTGSLLSLDTRGRVIAVPRSIDLSGIYTPLQRQFTTLNIEGAVVVGDEFVLLQRGHNKQPHSACIRFRLADITAALGTTESLGTAAPIAIRTYDLGAIDGVPLCFSDGAALPDGGMIFTAIAESTDDGYADGPCAGAAIGIINSDGRLCFLERVEHGHKIEGIEARVEGSLIKLLMVTDADEEAIPARLLSAEIAGYPFR